MTSMDTDNLKATIVQPKIQTLTLEELQALHEKMQGHMDKAITYGQRSANQIGNLTALADLISGGLLPQLEIHMGYMGHPAEPLIGEVGDKIKEFGETVTDWGDTLGMIAKEYNTMIHAVINFVDRIEKQTKAD